MPFFCRAGIETRICCESAWLGQSMAETHFHCYALPLCVSQPPLRVQVHILYLLTQHVPYFLYKFNIQKPSFKRFDAYVTFFHIFLPDMIVTGLRKIDNFQPLDFTRKIQRHARKLLHRADFRFRWYQFSNFSREIEASKSQTKINATYRAQKNLLHSTLCFAGFVHLKSKSKIND